MTSELRTRTISAIVLGSAVLFITWWSATAFEIMCILGAGILFREWRGLTKHRSWWWVPIGMIYIGAAVVSLMHIREFGGWFNTYELFFIVWSGDAGAYLIGRKFGRHKIAPTISPGKSWEGLLGAIVASSIAVAIIGGDIVYGILFSVLGLLGDLFESSLKRHADVKDSGTLIPGHGGLFDRVDALIPCAIGAGVIPLIFLLISCFQGNCL